MADGTKLANRQEGLVHEGGISRDGDFTFHITGYEKIGSRISCVWQDPIRIWTDICHGIHIQTFIFVSTSLELFI